MKVVEVNVDKLTPYAMNPRFNDSAVDAVANSIRDFGFKVPIVADKNGVIVAGHTRLKAAKKLGLKTVPVVYADDLDEEQIRAFRLADNKVSELATWDPEKLEIEMEGFTLMDLQCYGFKPLEPRKQNEWFDRDDRDDDSREEGNDEYNDFLDKFEAKKTTDDCYTPDIVYDAVADWVAKEYKLDRKHFVRPFYPGGNYQAEEYRTKDVVVDNPPFSILTEILNFYTSKNIPFFLFAPALTLFGSGRTAPVCYIASGCEIIYENGAHVNTGFITNPDKAKLRAIPELYAILSAAMEEYASTLRKELPKYSYPDEVITATKMQYLSRYGQSLTIYPDECERITELDAQKEAGKALYGGGFLISEKAAAEKAAAEKAAAEKAAATRWPLSERERAIVKRLSK
jgi:hypothetical protein